MFLCCAEVRVKDWGRVWDQILMTLCAPFGGNLSRFAQVELAGAEVGQGVNVEELVGAGLPEVRQVALGELLQARLATPRA